MKSPLTLCFGGGGGVPQHVNMDLGTGPCCGKSALLSRLRYEKKLSAYSTWSLSEGLGEACFSHGHHGTPSLVSSKQDGEMNCLQVSKHRPGL